MRNGERVIVNTGGDDSFGTVTGDEQEWKRYYPSAARVGGPAVRVKFEANGSEQWIPSQYVRRAPEESP